MHAKKDQAAINEIRQTIILILIALLINMPFFNKAYHIDDPFFLKIVEQVLEDKLHLSFLKLIGVALFKNIFEIHTNSPLMRYYLLGIIEWSGCSKVNLAFS